MAKSADNAAETQAGEPAATPVLERRRLMADFVVAGELERTRIAEAIHDDSIQVIAAMGMRLQMLRRAIADPAQISMLDEAEQAVRLSIERLRSIVFELQPPGLDGEGLAVALAIALEAASGEGALVYRLEDQMSDPPAAEEGALLFRIAQEALANVREHAHASTAVVTLLQRDGGHAIRIADDGRGCSPELIESGPAGYGFASMRARIGLAAGSLSIESVPGQGTVIEAWLPDLARAGAADTPG